MIFAPLIYYAPIQVRTSLRRGLLLFLILSKSCHGYFLGLSSAIFQDGIEYNERWKKLLDVDMENTLNVILPLLPKFKARSKGQIALFSSIFSIYSPAEAMHYGLSKDAILTYGQQMRAHMLKHNVSVCVVLPGLINKSKSIRCSFLYPGLSLYERVKGLLLYGKSVLFRKIVYISGKEAAHQVKSGLENDKELVAFPFFLFLLFWFIRCLPPRVKEVAISFFQ